MLTPKQQRFVDEYLIDLNATQAAIRAGYSPRTAKSQGQRLLTNVDAQEAIQAGLQSSKKRAETDADRVIFELKALAFSDIGDILDFTSASFRMKPGNEIPEAARRAISSVKIRREVTGENDPPTDLIEFRLWPKDAAIDKLCRHLGLFKDKLEIDLRARPVQELDDAELQAIAAQAQAK